MEREVDLSKPSWKSKSSQGAIWNVPIYRVQRFDHIGNKDMDITLTSVAKNLFDVYRGGIPNINRRYLFPALKTESGTQE